jgi:hypothetical protein
MMRARVLDQANVAAGLGETLGVLPAWSDWERVVSRTVKNTNRLVTDVFAGAERRIATGIEGNVGRELQVLGAVHLLEARYARAERRNTP